MKTLYFLSIIILFSSCSHKENTQIVQQNEIEKYLNLAPNQQKIDECSEEITFWENKYLKATNQHTYLIKMAGQHEILFELTENVDHLNTAITLYDSAANAAKRTSASILRALARNYISAHKFKEAKQAIDDAYALGEGKVNSEKMMFDISMEIGDYSRANQSLEILSANQDFDYLIREAKFLDHEGKLDQAIFSMEKALLASKNSGNESQILWTVTNLADFYGHAGDIEKSYEGFKEALSIDPSNSYALKGIANIAYSNDKNFDLAKLIIEKLNNRISKPEYQLLLADIAQLQNDKLSQTTHINNYKTMVADAKYGNMYNKYSILLNPKQNLEKALFEVNTRPTAETYTWLAWVYHNIDDNKKAQEVFESKVSNKTFEPESLYYLANFYKSIGSTKNLAELKDELSAAKYELGPVKSLIIDKL